MKKQHYFLLILAIATSQLRAQTKLDSVSVVITDSRAVKSTVIYLDGQRISQQTLDFIKPDDIQSFDVEKGGEQEKIYVKLKKDLNYKFLSMAEIASKHIRRKLEHPLFFVNEKLVTDSLFLLGEHLVRNIKVHTSETLPYYEDQKFDLVKIVTTVPTPIYIRGGIAAN